MSGTADDVTFGILMRIQGGTGQVRKDRRNTAGLLLMVRATAGDVDARHRLGGSGELEGRS